MRLFRKHSAFVALTALLLLVAMAAPVYGQRITGGIAGTVVDPQGALVPGAKITVANQATGFKLDLTSSSTGSFEAPDLAPAVYKVTVQAQGFNTLNTTATVRVGVVTPVTAKMQVGTTATEVTVEGAAVAVDTTHATVQGVITGDRINDIPLNGRNFLDLAQQEPGVQTVDGGSFDPTKNQMVGVSVGGRSGRVTRIQVDGVDITDETVGTTVTNVSNESIAEFGISQASMDPSTDMTSSGSVNIVTRSGSNALHGSVFANFRDHQYAADPRIDKTDPSDPTKLSPKPPFRRRILGGQMGGPFVKDKLFWHVDYERNWTRSQQITTITQFPQFNGSWAVPMDERMASGRVDWNISNNVRAFYRMQHNWNNGVTGFGGNDLEAFSNLNNTNLHVAGLDATMGNFTHQVRFSYVNFNNIMLQANDLAGTPATLDPGGQKLDTAILSTLYVGSDYLAPQNTFQDNTQTKYDGAFIHGKHTFRYGAEYNKIVQAGIFNFWGVAPQVRARYNDTSVAFASTSPFAPGGAQNPLNFPLDRIRFGNGLGYGSEKPVMGFPRGGFFNNRVGIYFQDSVRVTPRLTVNAAVRWIYNSGLANGDLARAPLFAQFDPALSGKPNIPKNNFAPQLGFAWDVTGSGKTVIRGGVGINYETNLFNSISFDRSINLPPGFGNETPALFSYSPVLLNPKTGAVLADFSAYFGGPMGAAIPAVEAAQAQLQAISADLAANWPQPGVDILANQYGGVNGNDLIDPRFKTPYAATFNAGVQREIKPGLVLAVDYIRNRGVHSNLIRDMNRLGAANTLNVPSAITYINDTFNDAGCGSDLTPGTAAYSAAMACTIAAGYGIGDFADFGLDGGAAADGYAFSGQNRNFRDITVIQAIGLSLYQAVQMRLTGKIGSLGPVKNVTTNVTYALSRFQSTSADQDFLATAARNDKPTSFFGPAYMDRTHQIGVSFVAEMPGGFKFATTNSIRTALANSLFIPQFTSGSGEIFFTDLDGDGVTVDPLPGTNRGAFGRSVKAQDINKYIENFNTNFVGKFTPAGQALIDAGLMTAADLTALGATIQPITPADNQRGNPNFVNTDIRLSRPIKIRERFVIEPQVDIFNVFNVANWQGMQTSELTGETGSPNGTPRGAQPLDSGLLRVGSGSGSFAPGTLRAFQFNIRFTF